MEKKYDDRSGDAMGPATNTTRARAAREKAINENSRRLREFVRTKDLTAVKVKCESHSGGVDIYRALAQLESNMNVEFVNVEQLENRVLMAAENRSRDERG